MPLIYEFIRFLECSNEVQFMKTLHSIQYLRAIAAIAVVIYHIKSRAYNLGFEGPWPDWLRGGVDLFFVISGFIMVVTTAHSKITPLKFLFKRFRRIAPIYWIWTSLAVILGANIDLHVLASYAFIPWLHPSLNEYWPILVPGWTLNYEMFFYVIFAICMFLPRRIFIPTTVIVLISISILGALFKAEGVTGFYTDPIIIEFCFGMLIALAWMKNKLFMHWAFIPLALAMTITLDHVTDVRILSLGVPAALMVIGMLSIEEGILNSPWATLLGNSSYSLYLVHGFSLTVVYKLCELIGINWVGYFPIALFSSLVAGIIAYLYIELPIEKRLRGQTSRKERV